MGEGKKEEEKKDESKGEDNKEEEKKEDVPEEIVLRIALHCEACARKVTRSLQKFPGVEHVITDCAAQKVIVKGKTVDPMKVCERVHKKCRRYVELISPLPKALEEEKKVDEEKKEEEKKDKPPTIITVNMKMSMHCESCAQKLHRQINKIPGVESVETNLESNDIIVKGVVEPNALVETVHKKFKRQVILVVPQEEKKEEEKKHEENKPEEGEKKEQEEKNKEEMINKSLYWTSRPYYVNYAHAPLQEFAYPPAQEYAYPPAQEYAYPPAPQMFSDENPNACKIM